VNALSTSKPPVVFISGSRVSKSGDASRNTQLMRLKEMTVEQRMSLALELGRMRRQLLGDQSTLEETPGTETGR
jgi:hypothetical protein